MRLLLLQCDSLFESYGGIEYYLDDLLCSASDVFGPGQHAVFPQRKDHLKPLERPYGHTAVRFSKNRFVRKVQNRYSLRYFLTALRQARALRPDRLVCGHVSLGPLTAAVSWLTGIPYLSCVYGYEAWGSLPKQDEWALKNASAILSISHWTKQILVDRGYAPEKIEIIHPRLDSRLEDRPWNEPKASEPLRLLTVSRLDAGEQYKGHDHILHALKILRETSPGTRIHYTIQGDGGDRARLEDLTRQWGLEDAVTFRAAVKDRLELEKVYEQADVFAMPSRFGKWERRWRGEGFGIVFLEAAALGVPSIAYNCGGVTDILEDDKTGVLVPPDDIAALATALKDLAEDFPRRARLGRAAYEMVNKRFTRPAIAAEIALAFEAISKPIVGNSTASQSPQPVGLR